MSANFILVPDDWQPPLIAVIGMGMGKGDLSTKAIEWIKKAEVLAGGKRLLDMIQDHPGQKLYLGASLQDSLGRLNTISEASRVAVLASGDPFFFGIGRRLVKYFGKERLLVSPNVTSVQTLFARLGESWDDAMVMSLHGREDALVDRLLGLASSHSKVAVLTDPLHTPNWIAHRLLDAGIENRYIVVAENLGSPGEAIRRLSIREALAADCSALNVVAILAPTATD